MNKIWMILILATSCVMHSSHKNLLEYEQRSQSRNTYHQPDYHQPVTPIITEQPQVLQHRERYFDQDQELFMRQKLFMCGTITICCAPCISPILCVHNVPSISLSACAFGVFCINEAFN